MEKIKSPAYSTDYVQNICNEMAQKQGGTVSCAVWKNNWLHPDTDLFSKHHVKDAGFGFLLAIK